MRASVASAVARSEGRRSGQRGRRGGLVGQVGEAVDELACTSIYVGSARMAIPGTLPPERPRIRRRPEEGDGAEGAHEQIARRRATRAVRPVALPRGPHTSRAANGLSTPPARVTLLVRKCITPGHS